MPQPSYSPDFAFLELFPLSKTEETQEKNGGLLQRKILPEALKTIPKSAYQKCFEDWKKRWHKHI